MLFRKQKTFRTPQKLPVQLSVDQIDASYDIIKVASILFLRHCTKN